MKSSARHISQSVTTRMAEVFAARGGSVFSTTTIKQKNAKTNVTRSAQIISSLPAASVSNGG